MMRVGENVKVLVDSPLYPEDYLIMTGFVTAVYPDGSYTIEVHQNLLAADSLLEEIDE